MQIIVYETKAVQCHQSVIVQTLSRQSVSTLVIFHYPVGRIDLFEFCIFSSFFCKNSASIRDSAAGQRFQVPHSKEMSRRLTFNDHSQMIKLFPIAIMWYYS